MITTPCILARWKSKNGYGLVRVAGKLRLAHRYAYEQQVGPIPTGMDLDHLCRNRQCMNPEHLEPVTRKVNLQRGLAGQKQHCPKGHEYTVENTYRRSDGSRRCRTCTLAGNRTSRQRPEAKERDNARGRAKRARMRGAA